MIYLISFDVISRMSKTSPYIPYELSKYLMLVMLVWGLIHTLNKGYIYLIIPVLLLPSFFIDRSLNVEFSDIINNGIGPLNMGLAITYFYRKKINRNQLFSLLNLLLYTSITVLAFAFFKTPDYEEIDYLLGANSQTTGGFGSNQVSTILGLGAIITAINLISGNSMTVSKWLDIVVLLGFIFQGLLTFSRGGMIAIPLCIAVFIYYAIKRRTRSTQMYINKGKVVIYASLAIIVSTAGFIYVNKITGNNLSLRYQGETAGTIDGYKEKDINSITTSRSEIFFGDIELWYEYPFWGAGVGSSKYLRNKAEDVAAHIEFSRLLAEHGLLGLLIFTIWISTYFNIRYSTMDSISSAILSALFILALYTSFHAAMRTYITPLLTGISMLSIGIFKSRGNKNDPLHRQ